MTEQARIFELRQGHRRQHRKPTQHRQGQHHRFTPRWRVKHTVPTEFHPCSCSNTKEITRSGKRNQRTTKINSRTHIWDGYQRSTSTEFTTCNNNIPYTFAPTSSQRNHWNSRTSPTPTEAVRRVNAVSRYSYVHSYIRMLIRSMHWLNIWYPSSMWCANVCIAHVLMHRGVLYSHSERVMVGIKCAPVVWC